VTTELEAARLRIVARHGPWSGYNVRLGDGVHTMGAGLVGAGELSARRTVQVVSDLCGGSVEGLRVLDLGCLEGLYAIELALRGAQVVALDGREANVAKTAFARDALGLGRPAGGRAGRPARGHARALRRLRRRACASGCSTTSTRRRSSASSSSSAR
jgi:SAM-dependent methyltransferase